MMCFGLFYYKLLLHPRDEKRHTLKEQTSVLSVSDDSLLIRNIMNLKPEGIEAKGTLFIEAA
jgi:hypothetical protein